MIENTIESDNHTACCLCDLLHQMARLCTKMETRAIAQAQLTLAEYHALNFFGTHSPAPLEQAADALDITRSRLTRILDGLESKGLVQRVRGRDRRQIQITVTPSGQDRLERATATRHAVGMALLSNMESDEQRQQLYNTLHTLCEQMQK